METLLLFAVTAASVRAIGLPGYLNDPFDVSIVPPRLDCVDLFTNSAYEIHRSLFIQALNLMQGRDTSRFTSWTQLAGIHGEPYNQAWDYYELYPKNLGYCPHGSTKFPHWHRAYMGQIETHVKRAAMALANDYNDEKWMVASNYVRLCYWDWASDDSISNPMPYWFTDSTLSILTPSGYQTVHNPLSGFAPASGFIPSNPNYRSSRAQNWQSWMAIQSRDEVRLLFDPSVNSNWAAFATHTNDNAGDSNPNQYHSVEHIHDNVHGWLGNTMGVVSLAAFDPIFFFHHANVDRLLTLWELAMQGQPNSQIDSNTASSPLPPFRNEQNQDDPWLVRDLAGWQGTTKMFYTYPEIIQHKNDPAGLRAALMQKYSFKNPTVQFQPTSFSGRDSTPTDAGQPGAYAHFEVDKHCLGEAFYVKFFVNGHFATAGYVFAMNSVAGVTMAPLIIGGSAVLTHALMNASLLDKPEQWKKAVTVKVETFSGRDIPLSQIYSLKIKLQPAIHYHSAAEIFSRLPSSTSSWPSPIQLI
ncbi:hypothetical protein BC830DRAFT_1164784 [Chytriomyces sp. MP71]|nr:hypothetical protein BC830DRAFT_1164784 [Chytriomyces sp. MP71]